MYELVSIRLGPLMSGLITLSLPIGHLMRLALLQLGVDKDQLLFGVFALLGLLAGGLTLLGGATDRVGDRGRVQGEVGGASY